MRMGNGVVFAVAGSKGGVGKTTTSINLSAVLAALGYDTVLVEMDLAMANVGDFLDLDVRLEGEDPTLHEALAGTVSVVDTTYNAPGGFDVLPSGATLRGFVNANVEAVSGILATLRFAYDVVIIDTGAGVMPSTVVSLALADETVLISSPRVASVRDTSKTRDLTRQVGGTVAGVVFVKSGTGRSPGVDHIAEFLSVDLLGHVPEDGAVASAQDTGRPVVVAETDSDAARAYRALGKCIAERVEALGATKSTTLSADRLDRDGSGFAFVDAPDENEEDATDVGESTSAHSGEEPEASAASVASHATNGQVENENGATAHPSSHQMNGATAGTGAVETDDEPSDPNEPETDDESSDSDGTETGDKPSDSGETETEDKSSDSNETGDEPSDSNEPETDDKSNGSDGTEMTDDLVETDERETVDNAGDETSEPDRTDDADSIDDTDEDTSAEDTDDTGRDEPVEVTETPHEDTGGDDPHDTEGERSASRRFIDRAIGLVDRGDD